ncbi:MAG: hypothetical protein F4022_09020 [Gemmatimonadetes bacterium]|nr:hypothetical protein [Gemmatimonadota bacterium]MYK66600.1 hypothetical protein [Gemmatimonadota bacterium]
MVDISTNRTAYRYAFALALGASFLLAWVSPGVGLIGADGDPANAMYIGVFAVGGIGALVSRLRPLGMARTLVGMAIAQAAVAAIALFGGLGRPWSGPLEIILSNGFFIALFLGSAWLFRRAATASTNDQDTQCASTSSLTSPR